MQRQLHQAQAQAQTLAQAPRQAPLGLLNDMIEEAERARREVVLGAILARAERDEAHEAALAIEENIADICPCGGWARREGACRREVLAYLASL